MCFIAQGYNLINSDYHACTHRVRGRRRGGVVNWFRNALEMSCILTGTLWGEIVLDALCEYKIHLISHKLF